MKTPGNTLSLDLSRPGQIGVRLTALDVPEAKLPPKHLLREGLNLPEMSQNRIVRYFVRLSRLNYNIDTGPYPLGSCTMKYNPKVHEDVAALPDFSKSHPLAPIEGSREVMWRLQEALKEISGMDAVSLTPAAGAQGELAGILTIKAYLADTGEEHRRKMLIPDSAHGTNPATAAMAGFEVVKVPTDKDGNADLEFIRANVDNQTAGAMITQPSTLGLFDPNIVEISAILHRHGALLYGDGANQNAFMGRARFGDMGFDVIHLNLHKTFATPHGGGGPGSGPICVKEDLAPYIPGPVVERDGERFVFATPEKTCGKMLAFNGHFGMLVRALTYILSLGSEGLREISDNAVLNANYIRVRLQERYKVAFDRICMHEVVLSGSRQKADHDVKALDIAKRLIDYDFHPPTIYFPLIVDEALMIEPTESEGLEELDDFCSAMLEIAVEAASDPQLLKDAPSDSPVGRLDEVTAARKPVLSWRAIQAAKEEE